MMRSVVAMLRKEWLENPLVLRLPLFMLACGALLFISLMSNTTLQHNMFFEMSLGGDVSDIHKELGDDVNMLITGGAGLLSMLLAIQYFPRTLRKERAEGSIMFWRSMPVSDLKTHLVKLTFGLLVIPLVCSGLVLAADFMLWLLNISTDQQLALLYRQTSLGYVLLHWVEFLARMALARRVDAATSTLRDGNFAEGKLAVGDSLHRDLCATLDANCDVWLLRGGSVLLSRALFASACDHRL